MGLLWFPWGTHSLAYPKFPFIFILNLPFLKNTNEVKYSFLFCVSYDIKIYSSTPGLAGRDLNPFCSYAGALKKCGTPWERVCNKLPATAEL